MTQPNNSKKNVIILQIFFLKKKTFVPLHFALAPFYSISFIHHTRAYNVIINNLLRNDDDNIYKMIHNKKCFSVIIVEPSYA